MLTDLRYALRQFGKAPGYAITAVLTLALGIGANTAIYSIIHGALRLPYPHSERMVAIQNVFPQGSYYAASYPDFLEWRAKAGSFSQLVASFPRRATWNGESFGEAQPETVNTELASEGFFSMFGMRPVAGRDFLPGEHQTGSAPVCIVAESFWREELHADPAIAGRSLDLDGKSCTVAGVMPVFMPAVFRPTQVWLPLETNKPWDQHGTNYLLVRGMLRPGVSESKALAELATIQAQIDKQFPNNKHGIGVHLLSQAIFGNLRSLMQILLAAVAFILLIACVNLANMLLARASDRTHEFALRRALGASPRRLLQQTLSESVLLSLGGAVAGLAVAAGLTHIPIAAWPKGFVPPSQVHLDGTVLAFTCLLGVATGVFFGIIPALRILRQDDKSALQPGRTITEPRSHGRTRAVLVISEIALSMLLVAGALSVAMRFTALLRVDPGVNARNAMVMTVVLPQAQYPAADDQLRFYRALTGKLSALPGVVAVGGSVDTPFSGANANGGFQYEGQPDTAADKNPFAEKHYITPGYLAAIGAQLWEGRDFSSQDAASAPQVAIINRTMAQKLWPGQSAVGKRLKPDNGWVTIAGVVRDIEFAGPGEPPAFQIYRPVEQAAQPALSFVVRTSPRLGADPLTLSGPARATVASLDPKLAVANFTSLELLSRDALAGQRTSTTVTAVLGALALLLASIGVYGVMAYSVSRRQREFGIRIALGANRLRILRLLYSSVFRLAVSGMAVGVILAWLARVWIASLVGAQGTSPGAIVLGGLLLSAVAAIAAAVPARRATRIQPVEALRNE
jgi:putative ABC transport system permease protein